MPSIRRWREGIKRIVRTKIRRIKRNRKVRDELLERRDAVFDAQQQLREADHQLMHANVRLGMPIPMPLEMVSTEDLRALRNAYLRRISPLRFLYRWSAKAEKLKVKQPKSPTLGQRARDEQKTTIKKTIEWLQERRLRKKAERGDWNAQQAVEAIEESKRRLPTPTASEYQQELHTSQQQIQRINKILGTR